MISGDKVGDWDNKEEGTTKDNMWRTVLVEQEDENASFCPNLPLRSYPSNPLKTGGGWDWAACVCVPLRVFVCLCMWCVYT